MANKIRWHGPNHDTAHFSIREDARGFTVGFDKRTFKTLEAACAYAWQEAVRNYYEN